MSPFLSLSNSFCNSKCCHLLFSRCNDPRIYRTLKCYPIYSLENRKCTCCYNCYSKSNPSKYRNCHRFGLYKQSEEPQILQQKLECLLQTGLYERLSMVGYWHIL